MTRGVQNALSNIGRRRWLNFLGTTIGIGLIAALAWRLDWAQFIEVLRTARPEYVLATFLAITMEQFVRGWKWRQILIPLSDVRTSHLFGAIMAGYLANLFVPLGVSPFVRSWIVARAQHLSMSSVLATVTIDRLVDGLVFSGIVVFVVLAAVIPDASGNIGHSLLLGAGGSTVAIVSVFVLFVHHKRRSKSGLGIVLTLVDRLPGRFAAQIRSLAIAFADGIVWPREHRHGAAIVLASVGVKLIAATHLLWAGLAFGILLDPLVYLALLAILGFVVILAHTARVPAGFVLGAVFSLGLFGVADETSLAMVTIVMVTNILAVGLFGVWGLWLCGVSPGELSQEKAAFDGGP